MYLKMFLQLQKLHRVKYCYCYLYDGNDLQGSVLGYTLGLLYIELVFLIGFQI